LPQPRDTSLGSLKVFRLKNWGDATITIRQLHCDC
jgi:hypothetical protein